MKKIFLLSSLVVGTVSATIAQDFTFDAATVTEHTVGLDLDDSNVVLDDAVTVYNHVNNAVDGVLSGMKWQIIDAFDNTVAPHIGWRVYSFCDNLVCYYGSSLVIPNTNPVAYNVFEFGDIPDRGRSDFKLQVVVPITAAVGTSGVVKVRAWSANQSDTATYVVIKEALSVNTLKMDDNRVSVFPNPGSGDANIYVNKSLDAKEVNVYNLLGSKVATYKLSGEISPIPVANLASGQYMLQVVGKDGASLATRKWVKK